jgi:SAM-dependent methyltransferase
MESLRKRVSRFRQTNREIPMMVPASVENFDETAYLRGNEDVAKAVASGVFDSGLAHFQAHGHREQRVLYLPGRIEALKAEKLSRVRPLLREDMPFRDAGSYFDFLTPELAAEFSIVDTENVSAHGYGDDALDLVRCHPEGLLLDCGAGNRPVYFGNVVNFEIVPYETTDVRGVGEKLPFKEASFDGVLSIAVLEHVKDPDRCAEEIARVLKPGGSLYCAVPFLQPYHGYPHHYYNMTHQGLRNLFESLLSVDDIDVIHTTKPIWTLTWFLNSWARGLPQTTRDRFERMHVSELMRPADDWLSDPIVTELPRETEFELASAFVMKAHKPQGSPAVADHG